MTLRFVKVLREPVRFVMLWAACDCGLFLQRRLLLRSFSTASAHVEVLARAACS